MKDPALNAAHPGEILSEDFLKPFNISQYWLAREIHLPARRVNEMKTNTICNILEGGSKTARVMTVVLFVMMGMRVALGGVGGSISTNMPIDDQVVMALSKVASEDDAPGLATLVSTGFAHRQQIIQSLIKIIDNPQSTAYAKGCAAHYLGGMRALEAVDSLAAHITNSPPGANPSRSAFHELAYGEFLPSVSALIKIGTPAIPAVIRNLAESDVEAVRGCSMIVLQSIDGDKSIVQLRLQKAFDAQTDATKKARLESALKSLTVIPANK